jgi:hypothetical protein
MQMCANDEHFLIAPAANRRARSGARCICPRRYLHVPPTGPRPSLFGGN